MGDSAAGQKETLTDLPVVEPGSREPENLQMLRLRRFPATFLALSHSTLKTASAGP
ncbi:hypothetical protein ABZ930_39870 [Streptomyces sp. NPDC046716]|uniref:hypothetical protein n=1 Tax=Streptomyces sp. NPDC046716 TaxID=3157093 RepID=UPI00340C8B7C